LLGEHERSLEHVQRALAVRAELAELDPQDTSFRLDLAVAHMAASQTLTEMGLDVDVVDHFEQARLIAVDLIEKNPRDNRAARFLAWVFADAHHFFRTRAMWPDVLRNSEQSHAAIDALLLVHPESIALRVQSARIRLAATEAMVSLDRHQPAAEAYSVILEALVNLELSDPESTPIAELLAQCFAQYGRLQLHQGLMGDRTESDAIDRQVLNRLGVAVPFR
jgi:tetratricopeptide (TPR) repeat protein